MIENNLLGKIKSWCPSSDARPSNHRQLITTCILGFQFFVAPTSIQAQIDTGASRPTSTVLQINVKLFLEPERGLNSEIRAGLARLEQTCTYTNPTKTAAANFNNSKSAQINKEIDQARKLAIEQQVIADKAIAEFRSVNGMNTNSCAAIPALLRVTDACIRYQKQSEIIQLVSQTSQSYFSETLARFKSYEAAVELEAKGCTRQEFAYKLWGAEQAHIVPKLKSSGQQISDFLK